MNYEAPIKLFFDNYAKTLVEKEEEEINKAVLNVGVDVDKEELIKALNYDRGQYRKGFLDRDKEIIRCKVCKYYKQINPNSGYGFCCKDLVASSWPKDGFCSRGERREE